MALTSWKQFNFFDKKEVSLPQLSDVGDHTNDGFNISTFCTSKDFLFIGTDEGDISILPEGLQKIQRSWQAHETGRITHMQQIADTTLLVSISEDLSDEPVLKVWALDQIDKKTNAPKCLSSLNVQNGRKQYPISTIAVLENLTQIAVGFANGAITIIRGDFVNDRGTKQRTVFESDEPITGVIFRETSSSCILYISTTGRILTLALSARTQNQVAKVLDDIGCGIGCMTFDQKLGDIIVVRDDAIQHYHLSTRGPSFAFEGPKQSVCVYRDNLAILSRPVHPIMYSKRMGNGGGGEEISHPTTFSVLDTDLKFLALHETLSTQIRANFIAWNDIFIYSQKGKLFRYTEKPLQQKLEIMYKRDLYVLAINLAQKLGADTEQRSLITRQYGDYLYRKGDYDTAMQQYLKAIDSIEPSKIIRKYLDSQRINHLIEYLEELHDHDRANIDHTTLLLNCYAKLKDAEKLEAFIKSGTNFDFDTAMSMCRQGGYFDQAVYLAEKHEEWSLVVDILIEDVKDHQRAIDCIWHLKAQHAFPLLMKYARVLLEHCPADTTHCFIDYYTGRYQPRQINAPLANTTAISTPQTSAAIAVANLASFIPLPYRQTNQTSESSSITTNDRAALSRGDVSNINPESNKPDYVVPSPRTAFVCFADHPDQFAAFVTAILKTADLSVDDRMDLKTVLYELHLIAASTDSYETQDRLEEEAKDLLNDDGGRTDPSNILLISHLAKFTKGSTMVIEQQGLYSDIFRSYTSAKDTSGAIAALHKYGAKEPSLYQAALTYFTSSRKILDEVGDEIKNILVKIDKEGILAPIQVIQILTANDVAPVSLVQHYLGNIVNRDQKDIARNSRLIDNYRTDTKAKQQEIQSLDGQPVVFQSRRCAACGRALELPTVHFLCKHSYHQSCINDVPDHPAECPTCAPNNANLKSFRQAQQNMADRHDLFADALNRSRTKFDTVTEFFGRGVITSAPLNP